MKIISLMVDAEIEDPGGKGKKESPPEQVLPDNLLTAAALGIPLSPG